MINLLSSLIIQKCLKILLNVNAEIQSLNSTNNSHRIGYLIKYYVIEILTILICLAAQFKSNKYQLKIFLLAVIIRTCAIIYVLLCVSNGALDNDRIQLEYELNCAGIIFTSDAEIDDWNQRCFSQNIHVTLIRTYHFKIKQTAFYKQAKQLIVYRKLNKAL